MSRSISVSTISAQFAQELIEHGAKKAEQLGKPMCLAVCDREGGLKAFLRMDGAPLLSVQVAQDKAYTSVSFGISTDTWHNFIKDDPPLLTGVPSTPRIVVFGGGYPLFVDGEMIGGIGVSGGHYTDDMEVAQAAISGGGLQIP